jgi:hypothetical protein
MSYPVPILCVAILLILAMSIQGCPWGYGYKYDEGTLPVSPVNFEEINSEYDDFNATAPTLGATFPLLFSSNRNSAGEHFDFVYRLIDISFDRSSGDLRIAEQRSQNLDVVIENRHLGSGLSEIHTPFDELGPLLIPNHEIRYSDEGGGFAVYDLLFSSGREGHQDIYYSHTGENGGFIEPVPVSYLNSEADDAYPCFNTQHSHLYFCSDRDGDFDIYRVETDGIPEVEEILRSGSEPDIAPDSILSSDYDDKCPYIAHQNFPVGNDQTVLRDMLVFTSNRPGGFGGFDLYYSMLEDGKWSAPVNFGAGINTEFDEYRPIVVPLNSYSHDFLMFSSNRPGGKGGYDLYYVGIQDIGFPTDY